MHITGPLQLDDMKKFEDLFIDSQRKHSAPVVGSGETRFAEPEGGNNPFAQTINNAAVVSTGF